MVISIAAFIDKNCSAYYYWFCLVSRDRWKVILVSCVLLGVSDRIQYQCNRFTFRFFGKKKEVSDQGAKMTDYRLQQLLALVELSTYTRTETNKRIKTVID